MIETVDDLIMLRKKWGKHMPSSDDPIMSEGIKYDADKPRLDLIPPEAMLRIGAVLTFGAKKYGDHNWRKGIKHSRLYAAAMRHLTAHQLGEDIDEESGLPHLWHAATNIVMMMSDMDGDNDDRYSKETSA